MFGQQKKMMLRLTILAVCLLPIAVRAEASVRFLDNGDGTVTDKDTGLIWLSHAGAIGELAWADAVARCKALKADDFEWLNDGSRAGDWRLPDYHEMMTLTGLGWRGDVLPEEHPFSLPEGRDPKYWSGSEGAYDSARAWSVQLRARGGRHTFEDKSEQNHAWPVRGEIKGRPEHLGAPALDADFESLTSGEQQRAELNALWDFKQLRRKNSFVTERTEAFLEVPPEFEEWYPSEQYTVAGAAPSVKLQILPNLDPEYFPEGEAYSAGWANWAYMTRSEDNRFFMAASDHRARGSKINLYEYRPEDVVLKRALDVSEALGWSLDMYTDGKIHGHMGIMPDGTLWAGTHRGPEPNEKWFAEGYRGSWLFSFNINTREFNNWGVPLIVHDLACHTVDTERGIFMGTGSFRGMVLSWDINEKRTRFAGYPPNGWIWHPRSMLLDKATGVFWSNDNSEEPRRFMAFSPELNEFKRYDLEVPLNGRLRGHTDEPDADGWYYWATWGGNSFFRFRPDWEKGPEIELIGVTLPPEGSDVLQMALCPEGKYVYYVPRRNGALIVKQYNIKTGEQKALCFLTDHFFRQYGYSMGTGVYGMNLSADGSFLVILENGAFAGRGRGFGGHPALLVVSIPEEERR